MKAFIVVGIVLALILVVAGSSYSAESEVDQLLNLLEKKGIVTKDEVYQFRAEIAVKKQEAPPQPKSAPEWTQNVKWSGDVRFRSSGTRPIRAFTRSPRGMVCPGGHVRSKKSRAR